MANICNTKPIKCTHWFLQAFNSQQKMGNTPLIGIGLKKTNTKYQELKEK